MHSFPGWLFGTWRGQHQWEKSRLLLYLGFTWLETNFQTWRIWQISKLLGWRRLQISKLLGWRICQCRLLGSGQFTLGGREGRPDCQNCLKIMCELYAKSWIEKCDSQGNAILSLVICARAASSSGPRDIFLCVTKWGHILVGCGLGARQMPK